LAYLVITPVVAFYLLRDWKALLLYMEGLVPPARRPAMMGFLNEYDAALGRYVRGALIEGTIVGTLTFLGLLILGVPNALLLGLVAGVCNLIPYIGIAVSVVPALIVALTMPSAVDGLWRVGLVFLVVQFVDGSVTGPKIVGGSVGLHPVAIMLAMALGGAVLGFVGFLLAVPLAVLIKMIGVRAVQRYKASAYYGEVQAMEQP
jgi:predicted PurR-regulated permease PerM